MALLRCTIPRLRPRTSIRPHLYPSCAAYHPVPPMLLHVIHHPPRLSTGGLQPMAARPLAFRTTRTTTWITSNEKKFSPRKPPGSTLLCLVEPYDTAYYSSRMTCHNISSTPALLAISSTNQYNPQLYSLRFSALYHDGQDWDHSGSWSRNAEVHCYGGW